MTAGANARAASGGPGAWVELTVQLALEDAELVADALGDVAEGAVALEPRIQTSDERNFAYIIEPDGAMVRAFLSAPLPPHARRALRRRLTALPLREPLPRLRYRAVEDVDWSEAWREHFTTLRIGRLVVHPSWEPADEGEAFAISLDPGRAFGTGQHATTRLCLEAIERECGPGDVVLDIGTGSGILALAAARLGAARVDALDTDPEAVESALRERAAQWPRGCREPLQGAAPSAARRGGRVRPLWRRTSPPRWSASCCRRRHGRCGRAGGSC